MDSPFANCDYDPLANLHDPEMDLPMEEYLKVYAERNDKYFEPPKKPETPEKPETNFEIYKRITAKNEEKENKKVKAAAKKDVKHKKVKKITSFFGPR